MLLLAGLTSSPPPPAPCAPPSPAAAGFLKFVVNNVKDLELLLMHNRKYCAEIAHNVSTLKRKSIVERAAEVGGSLSVVGGGGCGRACGCEGAAVATGAVAERQRNGSADEAERSIWSGGGGAAVVARRQESWAEPLLEMLPGGSGSTG